MNLARSSFSGASSALTALLSFSADLVARGGKFGRPRRRSAVSASPAAASSFFNWSAPASISATSAAYFAASAASPSTGVEYLREAARSANSRSSMRSSSAGSKSAAISAALRCWSASSSALIATSIAFTAGSTSAGELAARRSSRRTAADSAGTGEWVPPTASCASRRSVAIFSPCIIVVRRSASAVSSPSFGAQLLQFVGGMAQIIGLAGGALHARRDARRARCWRCAVRPTALPAPRRPSRARQRHRAAGGGSRHRPARARHAGRGFRPARSRPPSGSAR